MRKTLVAVLIFSVISSLFMVRFYFASLDIFHGYVNENTIVYLNKVSTIENLPAWTYAKSLWRDLQFDYALRFIFMIVIFWTILTMIFESPGLVTSLFVALGLWFISFVFMMFYFLASSDIYNEYVNQHIVETVHSMVNMERFPMWASCGGEWQLVTIDFVLRAIFMLFITGVLIKWIFVHDNQIVPLGKK